jgi:hypothetical protein
MLAITHTKVKKINKGSQMGHTKKIKKVKLNIIVFNKFSKNIVLQNEAKYN